MPFRRSMTDAVIDVAHPAGCGPVVISALVGRPVSAVERVLRRAGRPVTSCNAYDLSVAFDAFGYSLMWRGGFNPSVPLRQWLRDRDSSLLHAGALVLVVKDRGGLHCIAVRGSAWVCDAVMTHGRWEWTSDRDLDRWRLVSAMSVEGA
jgi:hypothetical protein